MLNAAALFALTVGLAPLQAGGAPPAPAAAAPAPAPAPAGRTFRLAQPATLSFTVDTNAGPIEGTMQVMEVVGRGLEGWGRFELVLRLDPSSVRTGDPLRDRVIAERVLQASHGPLVVGLWNRGAPVQMEGSPEGAPPWPSGIGALDERRKRKPVELRYSFEGDAQAGTLRVEHSATLEELGLVAAPHPFVEVNGPVRVRLEAPLVRDR